jgi:Tol biopolymer transport system component
MNGKEVMRERSKVAIWVLGLAGLSLLLLGSSAPWAHSWEEATPDKEDQLLSNTRQVTFEGRRAGEGYFSADGSLLTFQSERDPENPFFQIFVLEMETGDIKRVSPGYGKTTCSWVHPDGRKVLFASTHSDPAAREKQERELEARASGEQRRYSWDYDEYYELYEVDHRSGELRRLTDAIGYDAEGSWSPDGKLIAFSSNRDAYSRPLSEEEKGIFENNKSYFSDIYLMNADGSGVRRLTDAPGYDGGPFFSADGKRICWRRFSEDGATAEIFVMNVDGTSQRQITNLGAMSWAPFFHPSGDYLIFGTNLHGFDNFELYLVDAEGRCDPVRVSYTDGFDGLPAFSPDGKVLAWTSNRTSGGQSQIFFADWNDSRARELLGISAGISTDPAITSKDMRLHVVELASDEMEGRQAGTQGALLAAEYLASNLDALGFEPAGDDGTFFDRFEFTSGVSLGSGNRFVFKEGENPAKECQVDLEWRPVAFSKTGEIRAEGIAFAGYGIVAPEADGQEEYDSYVHLDVEGKWVLVFRYLPEEVSPERRQHLSPYSGLRYKALGARERGAKGILVVSGPNSQVQEELVELSFDAAIGTTSIAVISISDQVAESLLGASDNSLKELQDSLDGGDMVMGFEVPGIDLEVDVDIQREKSWDRNVVARLPSLGSDAPAVIVGAHYDHLGRGDRMSTLARPGEEGQIHYGADDNASGVAGLLEIGEYLVNQKRAGKLSMRRDLILAFWSGEELGLLGSNHYVREIGEKIGEESDISGQVAAYLNLDMVGRLGDKLIVQGVGSSSGWPAEIERRNAPVGLAIATQNDSYLPTDATSFYLKNVPILSAFTGTHEEYHSPRDTPETLNYDGMVKISRFMALVTRSLLVSEEEPDYLKMERPAQGSGRARLRAYLGTIPDYAQGDLVGVKLGGVTAGAPAENAGLRGGDVIVELAGRTIENIYDYTYAIEALKIGQPVAVGVIRNGERLTFEIIPGSRE